MKIKEVELGVGGETKHLILLLDPTGNAVKNQNIGTMDRFMRI